MEAALQHAALRCLRVTVLFYVLTLFGWRGGEDSTPAQWKGGQTGELSLAASAILQKPSHLYQNLSLMYTTNATTIEEDASGSQQSDQA